MIALVKAHKGNIYADFLTKDDTFYLKITKNEALRLLNTVGEKQVELGISRNLFIYSAK